MLDENVFHHANDFNPHRYSAVSTVSAVQYVAILIQLLYSKATYLTLLLKYIATTTMFAVMII